MRLGVAAAVIAGGLVAGDVEIEDGVITRAGISPGPGASGYALPGLIDQFEGMLRDAGLADQQVSVRMTGCPNGCARPYNSDIGLVGRSGTKYSLFVGGSHRGDRLSFLLQDLVDRDQVVTVVRRLPLRVGHRSISRWESL